MREEDRRQIIAFSRTNNHPVVDTAVTDYMQLLNPNSYQKGGWVLHMLRHQLGDSVFWKSIRSYYSIYAGKNASTDDLRDVFEKVSGKNLHRFFNQWLYTPGLPTLQVTWKQEKNKPTAITVKQIQPVLFEMPLEIAVTTASGKTSIEKLAVTKKEQTFLISTPEKVVSIMPDPGVNLLYENK
jgi:aminopeptidase N